MEFTVERILKHKELVDKSIMYQVKWLNYPLRQATWECESNFAKGNTVLREYKRVNGWVVEEESGGEEEEEEESGGEEENGGLKERERSNLVSPDQVVSKANAIAASWRLPARLVSFPEQGQLQLLLHRSHFFVVAEGPRGEALVADGQNWCLAERPVLLELQKLVGQKLQPVPYERQRMQDFCGSAAVAIAVIWARARATGNWPNKLVAGFRGTMALVERQLHKAERKPLQSGTIRIGAQRRRKEERECGSCGQVTKRTHSAHLAHQRLCSKLLK